MSARHGILGVHDTRRETFKIRAGPGGGGGGAKWFDFSKANASQHQFIQENLLAIILIFKGAPQIEIYPSPCCPRGQAVSREIAMPTSESVSILYINRNIRLAGLVWRNFHTHIRINEYINRNIRLAGLVWRNCRTHTRIKWNIRLVCLAIFHSESEGCLAMAVLDLCFCPTQTIFLCKFIFTAN